MWESDGQPLWRGRWFYRPGDFPALAKNAQQHEVFLSGLVSFAACFIFDNCLESALMPSYEG
jgi:hypothetical protein